MTSSDSTRVGTNVSRGPDVDATFSPERTVLLIIARQRFPLRRGRRVGPDHRNGPEKRCRPEPQAAHRRSPRKGDPRALWTDGLHGRGLRR